MKRVHIDLRGGFVKSVSPGTVILKGEWAENKSTQQSWPTFVLECFQRQQSLFSYAINCLNRLPVEFLMCYKFHVCFPRVDSAQAYCVRPRPVISSGLGRTLAKENSSTWHSRLLSRDLCLSPCFGHSTIKHHICTVHQWPCAMYCVLCADLFYSRWGVKAGEGQGAERTIDECFFQQHLEEVGITERTSSDFCLLKMCGIRCYPEAFTCRSRPSFQSIFNS